MNDQKIILMAKVITPVSFLCALVMIPTIIYAYFLDINKGLSIYYLIVPLVICLFWLTVSWRYMTKKWGWFSKR